MRRFSFKLPPIGKKEVDPMNKKTESMSWKAVTQVFKFRSRKDRDRAEGLLDALAEGKVSPTQVEGLEEVKTVEKNVALNEGCNAIWLLVKGDTSVDPYDQAHARIGVGDGTDPEDPTQTGLTGTNQLYKGMDSGYPQAGTDQKVVFQATFDEDEANWAWNEWTVDNGSGDNGGYNLNRRQEYIGSKAGGVWVLRVTLTLGSA